MPRVKPLVVGENHFDTQWAGNAFVKTLLNDQRLRAAIRQPHHAFFCALITRHPRNRPRHKSFTVEYDLHGTSCFYVTQTDGSKTDFSYFKRSRGAE